MKPILDNRTFGPWAVVTGASSGIGREISRQVAASGINVVLIARRVARLEEVGRSLAADFGVAHRVVEADLSTPAFFTHVQRATADLDVGLFVGNAGSPNTGELWKVDPDELARAIHLKVNANLMLVHHFARGLVARRRGGILLVSSIGVEAYVLTLGEGLHVELARHGVHVTVLMPGPTLTESMGKMGVDPSEMPMTPMPAERVAAEALSALRRNRPTHIAGRVNRLMARLMPRSLATTMMGALIGKKFAGRALAADAQGNGR
jgi:short-subunit dehydrogenase